MADHYGLDASWEEQLLAGLSAGDGSQAAGTDDLADRQHLADLLLDQNFFMRPAISVIKICPPQCRQLLGPTTPSWAGVFHQMRWCRYA